MNRLNRRLAALAGATILTGAAAAAEHGSPIALVNESPSLAEGLYVRAPGTRPRRGDVVAAAQPPAVRAYLASLGMPADTLLLKRVAAAGGDRVCADGTDLTAPGRRVRALAADRRGRTLPRWRGCRVLSQGELFLLGDTPTSFDSRYFGPVLGEDVTGVYREVATW